MLNESLSYLSVPLSFFGIAAIQAMSLQLILGGAGLLSLGHAAFFALGGYAGGIFAVFLAPTLGIPPGGTLLLICALGFGCLVAALAGAAVGLPCLRLSGDYLAVASLGFGEIVATGLKNAEWVGGTRGFKDIPKLVDGPGPIWCAAALVALFLTRLYRTHVGLAMMATRDDDIAARSLGISTRTAKLAAFALGSGMAGLAGGLYVFLLQFISPDEAGFSRSVEIVLAVVLGGMSSLAGSVLGALILVAIPELLRFAPASVSENRMLFFSLAVILIMIFRPQGLARVAELPKALARRLLRRGGEVPP